jgi:hypothetical protein
MWPLAVFLALVVGFYWFAFMATIWWCFNALVALWAGHFIRAAIWGCLAVGMILWWQGTDTIPDPWAFDKWLKNSAWVVGLAALLTFIRFCNRQRHQQAAQTDAPSLNINIKFNPSWDIGDCEVHEQGDPGQDLVTVDRIRRRPPTRRNIGAKQSPRRITGPTIIDQ